MILKIIIFFLYVTYINSFVTNTIFKKNIIKYYSKNKLTTYETNEILENIKDKYKPQTENQKKYTEILNNSEVKLVISVGSAGTGKTLFATLQAVEYLLKNKVERIIITRPTITVEEDIGFLPGTIKEKMHPWIQPIYDILYEFFDSKDVIQFINNNKIEICPIGYMRGRTFHNTYIIADEMQNSTPQQMKMILTRIGSNSKLVITGDNKQSDIKNSGLTDILERLSKNNNKSINKQIKTIVFNSNDIKRSSIVQNIIKLYDNNCCNVFDNRDKLIEKENEIQNKDEIINVNKTKLINEKKRKKKNGFSDCALIPKDSLPKNEFK